MPKEQKLKQMAIGYGFDIELVATIDIEFTNASDFGFEDGKKLGRYLPVQNKIQLYDTDTAEAIFPIYGHELMHAMQHQSLQRFGKTFGTILYWLALTFLRPWMEKDALEVEDRLWDLLES